MKDFQIVRLLGRGTTAEVYEARAANGRTIAVKIFPPHAPAWGWQAFQEAERLGKLNHPNLLRILGFGEDEGRPYLAMELVDGVSLERFVQDRGKLYHEAALRMVRGIAEGLRHAHAEGIVHGDLRPANILLRKGDPLDPVVCDFGLSERGSKEEDLAALAEILRFAAGDHLLVDRLRRASLETGMAEIDRLLAGQPATRFLPRRRGCLRFW